MSLKIGSKVRISREAVGALDFNPGGVVVGMDYGGVDVEVGELVGDALTPLHFRARVKEADLEELDSADNR
jgi:hypothetical protein